MKKIVFITGLLLGCTFLFFTGCEPDTTIDFDQLNAEVVGLKFYESAGEGVPLDERIYDTFFEQQYARFIAFELGIRHQPPGRNINLTLEVVYYAPDESELDRFDHHTLIGADWTGSLHYAHTVGWEEPGNWQQGVYLVEIYEKQSQHLIASETFVISSDDDPGDGPPFPPGDDDDPGDGPPFPPGDDDDPDDPAVQYAVSGGAVPAEGGTVTGFGWHDKGTTVTVTATANPGYMFVNWTEDGSVVSTDTSYTFTIDRHRSLRANFKPEQDPDIIGPKSGQIQTPLYEWEGTYYDAQFDFPDRTFSSDTRVDVRYVHPSDEDKASPAWQVRFGDDGKAVSCQPIRISVSGFDGAAEPVIFRIEESVLMEGDSLPTTSSRFLEAAIEDGKAVFYYQPDEMCSAESSSRQITSKQHQASCSYARGGIFSRGPTSFTFWRVRGWRLLKEPNFQVFFKNSQIENISDVRSVLMYADEAYVKLKGFGFKFKSDLTWPLTITMKNLGEDMLGQVITRRSGKKDPPIEIHEKLFKDHEKLRATVGHEFFHVVQAIYDPRYAIQIRSGRPDFSFWWLGEASSTWFESIMIGGKYISPTFREEVGTHSRGLQTYKGKSDTYAMELGYGAAGFLHYLVDKKGDSIVRKAWEEVRKQKPPYADLVALFDAVGSPDETARLFAEYSAELLSNNSKWHPSNGTNPRPNWPNFGVVCAANEGIRVEAEQIRTINEFKQNTYPFSSRRWVINLEELKDYHDIDRLIFIAEPAPHFRYFVYRTNFDIPGRKFDKITTLDTGEPFMLENVKPDDVILVVAVNVSTKDLTESDEMLLTVVVPPEIAEVTGDFHRSPNSSQLWHENARGIVGEEVKIVLNRRINDKFDGGIRTDDFLLEEMEVFFGDIPAEIVCRDGDSKGWDFYVKVPDDAPRYSEITLLFPSLGTEAEPFKTEPVDFEVGIKLEMNRTFGTCSPPDSEDVWTRIRYTLEPASHHQAPLSPITWNILSSHPLSSVSGTAFSICQQSSGDRNVWWRAHRQDALGRLGIGCYRGGRYYNYYTDPDYERCFD